MFVLTWTISPGPVLAAVTAAVLYMVFRLFPAGPEHCAPGLHRLGGAGADRAPNAPTLVVRNSSIRAASHHVHSQKTPDLPQNRSVSAHVVLFDGPLAGEYRPSGRQLETSLIAAGLKPIPGCPLTLWQKLHDVHPWSAITSKWVSGVVRLGGAFARS
jgi:hypothetical protein